MSTTKAPEANPYLSGPVPAVFFKTVFPIALIMIVNGLYTVIDALFLGIYAGADALTAVTLTFPIFMLLVAVSTMVSAGMASIIARCFGAGDMEQAKTVFSSAHVLSLVISILLAALFSMFGHFAISAAAGGDASLTEQGWRYIAILIYCSPLMLILSIQGDELRSEGRAGTMALIGVLSTLLNIVFNYVFIAILEWGTVGSAIGTVAAQLVAISVVAWLRLSGATTIGILWPERGAAMAQWKNIILLGLPPSLGFAGIALNSSVVIVMVRIWGGEGYADTIAAYGVLTRIMTFGFMPLMALNLAAQSMAGNNYGAKAFDRSNGTLITAFSTALIYAALFEICMIVFADPVGRLFVENRLVVDEIVRIMPVALVTYVLGAPLFVLAGYYQALGIAWAAGALSLSKPYLIAVPLVVVMPYFFGEPGIWYSIPAGDVLMLAVCFAVLNKVRQTNGASFGLFFNKAA